VISVDAVDAYDYLTSVWDDTQMVSDMNAADDQHIPLFFTLADRLRSEPTFSSRNTTRFQRATKRPGQSACSSSNQIVQRGRMGFVDVGIHSIVGSHLWVHPKEDRCRLYREIGPTQWALDTFIRT
jgi:hypothetical protein